jgi:hypothetical protein
MPMRAAPAANGVAAERPELDRDTCEKRNEYVARDIELLGELTAGICEVGWWVRTWELETVSSSAARQCAAVRTHKGPILVDLDEILYLRNSTENLIDCEQPALLAQ